MDDSNLFLTEQLFLVGRNFTLYLSLVTAEIIFTIWEEVLIRKEWTKKNQTKNDIQCVRVEGVNQLLCVIIVIILLFLVLR